MSATPEKELMSVTPQDALEELQRARNELTKLADALFQVNCLLDGTRTEHGLEKRYQDFIDEHEVTQWLDAQNNGTKLPSETLRIKLARREMDADLLVRRDVLQRKRARLKERISQVREIIEADRSILSALKEEAQGAGVRR